jgi:hypothetical protein
MSALSSCFIADYLYEKNPNDLFVLCIEQNSHVEPEYYHALDVLIQQNKHFTRVIRVKVDFRVMSLRRPINYMQSVGYYKSIATDVINQLGEETSKGVSTIWAPTTSRLWPFFNVRGVKFNVIEHGIGEYISAKYLKKSPVKRSVIAMTGLLSGYRVHASHDSVWLCSNAVLHSESNGIVQHNFASQFADYVKNFWSQYQESFPVAAQELKLVTAQIANNCENIYLYLPGDEIRYDHYQQFVGNQVAALGLSSTPSFIIKRHPGDTQSDYAQLLAPHGSCVVISELINSYVPVEFVATILKVKHVVGSCSSALFYLQSWQPNIKLHIYNDFDEKLLKPECVGLIQSLASVGLTNKQTH